jgi:hypothetical protein
VPSAGEPKLQHFDLTGADEISETIDCVRLREVNGETEMKNPMFVAFWKRIAYQVGIGFAMALSIMLARVSDAEAQAQPVGVLVQVPSTGNDCVAGSCSAHNPVPFGGSLAIPYTTTRSFPNGDEYQIDGMISIGENADGTSLPGKMYVTITFIGGPGTGGTSVGAPDQFLLHDYLDYTQNGSANDLTVEAIGSFSSGVGSGSSVTVSAEYCGGITSSPVLGPISPPPSSFSTSAVTFVSPCSAGGLLVDTSFTFNFRNGTTPGSYIRVGTIPAPPVTGAGTHDFYGNLFSDILWRNTNGDTTIWAMNGSQVLSTPDLGTVPASWVIVGQRDFNGDGNCDILWRNTSGDTSIWLMDGGQVLSAVDLGVVPTSWVVLEPVTSTATAWATFFGATRTAIPRSG